MSDAQLQPLAQAQPQVDESCWGSITQCFSNCLSNITEINVGSLLPNISRDGEWNCTEMCFAVTITVAAVAGLAVSFFKALSFGVILFGVVTVLSAARLITYLSGCAPAPEPQGEASADHSPRRVEGQGETGGQVDQQAASNAAQDLALLAGVANGTQMVPPDLMTDLAKRVYNKMNSSEAESKRDTHTGQTETGERSPPQPTRTVIGQATATGAPPQSQPRAGEISQSPSAERLQLPSSAQSQAAAAASASAAEDMENSGLLIESPVPGAKKGFTAAAASASSSAALTINIAAATTTSAKKAT